jgi:hypothetical protein
MENGACIRSSSFNILYFYILVVLIYNCRLPCETSIDKHHTHGQNPDLQGKETGENKKKKEMTEKPKEGRKKRNLSISLAGRYWWQTRREVVCAWRLS